MAEKRIHRGDVPHLACRSRSWPCGGRGSWNTKLAPFLFRDASQPSPKEMISTMSLLSSMSPYLRFVVWLLMLTGSIFCPMTQGRPRNDEEHLLPVCEARSVCGYVQLNDNGPNVQPLCRCVDGMACPLEWDPIDGHTVVHGSDQYKFCERILPLLPCSTSEPAYTSYTEMSFVTTATLVNTARVHCSCPADHLLVRNDTSFHQYDNGVTSISTSYLCKPPPVCSHDSTCAAIASNRHQATTFITRHCACPEGHFCPSHPDLAKDRVDLDKGSYFVMQCL